MTTIKYGQTDHGAVAARQGECVVAGADVGGIDLDCRDAGIAGLGGPVNRDRAGNGGVNACWSEGKGRGAGNLKRDGIGAADGVGAGNGLSEAAVAGV